MIETGIYEQIINSLFKSKIESADDSAFFIENKKIGREEAATILSRYLFLKLAEQGFRVEASALTPKESKMALMLYYDMFDAAGRFESLQQMFDAFAADRLLVEEMKETVYEMRERCVAPEKEDNSALAFSMPLKVHGVYTKAQIQVAIGTNLINRKSSSREGASATTTSE